MPKSSDKIVSKKKGVIVQKSSSAVKYTRGHATEESPWLFNGTSYRSVSI